MRPALLPAERPGVVRRCGKPSRAGGQYPAACQAPPATGPAGITLASPVEANTTPDTVRQGSDTPAADSSRRCAAAPPASNATSAATATPSQDTRSPPACANAARTSLAAPA